MNEVCVNLNQVLMNSENGIRAEGFIYQSGFKSSTALFAIPKQRMELLNN